MTIKQILKKYHKLEIELLLAHVLKKQKEFLYLNKDHRLTNRQMSQISQMVKRRKRENLLPIFWVIRILWGIASK